MARFQIGDFLSGTKQPDGSWSLAIDGFASGGPYLLAAASPGITLAAGAATPPVLGIPKGEYIIAYQFAGTSPQLVIEALGPDGVNYMALATVTASGQDQIQIGRNGAVRLRNAGTNSITSLSASIS